MGFIFNLLKRLIKTIIKLSLYLTVFATIIVLIPNLPPYTKFTSIDISPTQPRVGPLAPNNALNNAQRSYKGKLLGPEAFQIFKGELYTSLATGEIVKLSPGGHVTFVTTLGQPCSGLAKEHICGRPLGFQIDDKSESLYVADAYHGIWKVDLKTDKKQLLVSPRVEIEKRLPKLFNSIALGKNGDLYWTDSNSDFHLKDGAMSFLTDPSGRLFHYDAAKNKSKVLLDDLWFANGVVVSPDGEFVVVAESIHSRLLKYYIAGPKKGQSEVFVDGLPGVPDNLRALPDGSGALLGLYSVYDEEQPVLVRSLAATPLVRKFLARLQRLIEIPFEYLNNLYPHIVFEEIVYHIGHFKSISGLTPPISGLLQVDWKGNIIATYYNTDGTLGHISDAIVYNDKLYTGSPHAQDFLGTVPAPPLLKKAFESLKKFEVPKVETKTQQAAPAKQAPKQKIEEKQTAKVQEKPKVETKRKVEEKPQVTAKVTGDKPKVEEKKEAPKVAKPAPSEPKLAQQAKPAVSEPKLAQQAKPAASESKPAQQAKPAASESKPAQPAKQPQKPADSKPSVAAPKQAPTQQPPKSTIPPAKPEPTKKPTQTEPKPTTPKPEVKTTPPPKSTEKSSSPPPTSNTPKAAKTKTETPKKTHPPVKESLKTAEIKPKPIKEEIPSDTAKPTKETLKVIKKDGPAEIPVINQ